MNTLCSDATAALDGLLHDGMTICAGGFGLCGIPERLIGAIHDAGKSGLTVASDRQEDLLLRRREQGVRVGVSERRTGNRVLPARYARRAEPGGGSARRHPRLLHEAGVGTQPAEDKEMKNIYGDRLRHLREKDRI